MDGEYSYILKVRTASPQELRALIAPIRTQPAVIKTVTSIALLQIKDSGGVAAIGGTQTPPPEESLL